MKGKIVLVGGDEFLPSCREMDRAILETTGFLRPTVLIVPTAAAAERPSLAAQHGIRHFEVVGAETTSMMVLYSEDANDETLISAVDGTDIVYLSGGNPTHLLEVLNGSLLLEKIISGLERGLILAGSSAGAMVMGQRMRFRQWTDALGIVPGVAVLPHHERSSRGQTFDDVRFETREGLTIIGIDGATGCMSDEDGWRVLGTGSVTLYRGNDWERFEAGDTFTI